MGWQDTPRDLAANALPAAVSGAGECSISTAENANASNVKQGEGRQTGRGARVFAGCGSLP
jgi:hypothetical protein